MQDKQKQLIEKIMNMCSQRKLSRFGRAEWNGANEHALICLIKEAERTVELKAHRDWKYLLDEYYNGGFMIQNNDTKYGTDPNYGAPSALGDTPLQTLKNGWAQWSIPPFLVINADYYCNGISITDVL